MRQKDAIVFESVGLQFANNPPIFRNINFKIPTGSFHFLTGPSGAGKSSLLRLIYLSAFPTEGKVKIFGHDVKSIDRYDAPLFRRNIGVVFQEFRLLDHLTVLDNVALPLRVRGHSIRTCREKAEEILKWVGIPYRGNIYPSTLSGGQKQRAAIARAVVARPPILLADEPTGNVDDANAVRLLYLFEKLYKSGTTVIIATHNRALAKEFPYPELYLDRGALTLISPTEMTPELSANQQQVS